VNDADCCFIFYFLFFVMVNIVVVELLLFLKCITCFVVILFFAG
jgi:hypothetical protein